MPLNRAVSPECSRRVCPEVPAAAEHQQADACDLAERVRSHPPPPVETPPIEKNETAGDVPTLRRTNAGSGVPIPSRSHTVCPAPPGNGREAVCIDNGFDLPPGAERESAEKSSQRMMRGQRIRRKPRVTKYAGQRLLLSP